MGKPFLFALYTNILSPHQLPLFSEMMARLGEEECRYVSVRPPARERTKMGWGDAFEEKWVIEEASKPAEAREVITTAKTLMSGMRDVGLFEERARRGKMTFYMSERWFKPPIGIMRLLSPKYFRMALTFVETLKRGAIIYLPTGIYAAKDMARLCGLMSGDLRCLFKAPELEFERKPGGRIWLAQRRRGAEKYCLDKMRMWGYFVENAGRMSCGSCTRRSEVVELRSALVRSGVATALAPRQAAEFSLPCLDKATGCEQSHADACNPSLPHFAHSAPFLAPETGEGLPADQGVIDVAGQTPGGGINAGSAGSSAQAQILPQAPAGDLREGNTEIKVLWVGRMLDWKRVDTIVQAVREQTKRTRAGEAGPKITLDIYGTGPMEEKLKALARGYEDAIKFYPPVPIAEVRKLMREHDVYVLASNGYEGWGAVVSEALEEGMRVIGTYEAGSSATILQDSQLFHTGDAKRLRELLNATTAAPRGIGEWSAKKAAERIVCFAGGVR